MKLQLIAEPKTQKQYGALPYPWKFKSPKKFFIL